MIKKIFSTIISFILLFLVTTIATIYVTRIFLSSDNLTNLVSSMTSNIFDIDKIQLGSEYKDFNNFIDEEELKETYAKILSDYIRYNTGIDETTKPSVNELDRLLDKYCENYEYSSNNDIDCNVLKESLDDIDIELQNNLLSQNTYLKKVFSLVYSNKVLIICYVAIIVCIIILVLINKSIKSVLKYLATISIINAIGMYGLDIAINIILKETLSINETTSLVVKSLTSILNKIAIIFLAIGIAFIVILIILRLFKKKEKTPEIEVLDLEEK